MAFAIETYLPLILTSLQSEKVVELIAPTGTGKSTGIAARFMSAGYARILNRRVYMSIPTVFGVNSLYKHVSGLLGPLASKFAYGAGGNYSSNFEDSDFCVCTTQVVINRLVDLYKDGNKMEDLIVIIDEAHHTSQENYILMHICEWLLAHDFKLHVLMMTATPSIYDFKHLVPTKQFKIQKSEVTHFNITEHWLPRDIYNLTDIKSLTTPFGKVIFDVLKVLPETLKVAKGNILIFVPGEAEAEELRAMTSYNFPKCKSVIICSSIDREEMMANVADEVGIRKIIIATNIAESSVTIPNLGAVIDTLCCKEMVTKTKNGRNFNSLSTEMISQASRLQRRGRCGRVFDGHYWGMCTESFSNKLNAHTVSNFETGDKALPVLNLLRFGLPATEILGINPTDSHKIFERLEKLELYDLKKNLCTEFGKKVGSFSLPLEFSVFLLKCQKMFGDQPDVLFNACLLVSIITAKDTFSSIVYFPTGSK